MFQIIADFYEHKSVIVTSNLEFGQLNQVFGDNRLTSSIVERVVHHAHVIAFTRGKLQVKKCSFIGKNIRWNLMYDYGHKNLPLLSCLLPTIATRFTTYRQCITNGKRQESEFTTIRILKDKKPNPSVFLARNYALDHLQTRPFLEDSHL